MEDKKRILIPLKILDKIQEDNENARKLEESITGICKEGISFEQVFYILFFDAHPLAFRVDDSIDLGKSILCLQLYLMVCNSSLTVWRDRCSRFKTRENVQIFL